LTIKEKKLKIKVVLMNNGLEKESMKEHINETK
jgi:hypothetical protein